MQKIWNFIQIVYVFTRMIIKENPERLQNAALRTFHRLSMCQVVLTKRLFYIFELNKIWVLELITIWVFRFCCYSNSVSLSFEFCHKLSFKFLYDYIKKKSIVTIWVFELSHFEFLSSVTIWVKYCYYLSFVGENSLLLKIKKNV